jgi:hypothetical protein
MNITTTDDLDVEFAAHADLALELANETWLRVCVWPCCLTSEQQLQLADEIGCELIGQTHPNPAVYDQRAACRCGG